MNFFQIQNLQLLIFCVNGQEFLSNLDYALLCLLFNIIKVEHFYIVFYYFFLHLISSFLYAKSLLVSYAYVSVDSIDCNLLSSFELKVIFLISSVKTLCLSFLNLYCIFNIILLFFTNYL